MARTISMQTRDRCGWTPGPVLEVEEVAGAVCLRPAAAADPFQPDALFGCIRTSRPPLSAEEMDTRVAQMFREEPATREGGE